MTCSLTSWNLSEEAPPPTHQHHVRGETLTFSPSQPFHSFLVFFGSFRGWHWVFSNILSICASLYSRVLDLVTRTWWFFGVRYDSELFGRLNRDAGEHASFGGSFCPNPNQTIPSSIVRTWRVDTEARFLIPWFPTETCSLGTRKSVDFGRVFLSAC